MALEENGHRIGESDEIDRAEIEAAQAVHDAVHDATRPWPFTRTESAWIDKPPEPRTYLLTEPPEHGGAGVLVAGRVGLLTAPGGSGKSWALVQLAVSLATGAPWLGAKGLHVANPGRVALVLGEEDEDEARRRLYYAVKAAEPRPDRRSRLLDNLHVAAMAGRTCGLLTHEGRAPERSQNAHHLHTYLHDNAGDDGWRAVLLDPLSRFTGGGDENDNAMATRVVQELEALAKMPGRPAVLVAHHERKGTDPGTGQGAARGASAFVDGARWMARIGKAAEPSDKATHVLSIDKSNYTASGMSWKLRRPEGAGGTWEIVR